MGQRHQIYVIIANPLKKKDLSFEISNDKNRKEAELYFGTKNYSVLPFHNQWLYGATAVSLMSSIMSEVLRAKGISHPFSPDFTNLPYTEDFDKNSGYGTVKMVEKMVNYQSNLELAEIAGRFGFEKGFYIGDGLYNYKTKKGKLNTRKLMQYEFTNGDNNDGVTIIDTIKQKYCFINIFGEQDVSHESIYALPPMEPVSWKEYLKAYYPKPKDKGIIEGYDKHLTHLENRVLTKAELINYFPNSFINKLVKNK